MMHREHIFRSIWGALTEAHLKRKNMSMSALAVRIGRSQQATHGYIVGKTRPPLEEMPRWAEALGLNPEQTVKFINAAHEAHMPPAAWARLVELEAALLKAQAPADAAVAKRLRDSEAAILRLVELLREVEAVLLTPGLSADEIRRRRAKLVGSVRKAVEAYWRPDESAAGGAAVSAAASQ